MPTVDLLRLAEILDGAGFAYLEVSGGGVFDTAVRRGVESPWERIRALNERTETPLATALREQSGLPVGLYCQGAGGNALAAGLEAARGGADLIACAVYPVALTIHRVSGEAIARALAGFGLDTGVDVDALWQASELVDEHVGDQPVTPLAPRIAVRAAGHRPPPGLVSGLETRRRAQPAC